MSYQDIAPNEIVEKHDVAQFTIIDTRDKDAYNREHIPGAIRFNDQLFESLRQQSHKNRHLLIYCYHGLASRKIAEDFIASGFKNVYNLDGGWQAWEHYQSVKVEDALLDWLYKHQFKITNLERINRNNLSPLMQATKEGNRFIIQKLLNLNVDVNAQNYDGNSALWYACLNGEIKIVNLLIHHQADVNVRNAQGTTPLMNAAISGKFDVLLALVEAGAELHLQTGTGHNLLEISASREVTNYLEPLFQLKNIVIH